MAKKQSQMRDFFKPSTSSVDPKPRLNGTSKIKEVETISMNNPMELSQTKSNSLGKAANDPGPVPERLESKQGLDKAKRKSSGRSKKNGSEDIKNDVEPTDEESDSITKPVPKVKLPNPKKGAAVQKKGVAITKKGCTKVSQPKLRARLTMGGSRKKKAGNEEYYNDDSVSEDSSDDVQITSKHVNRRRITISDDEDDEPTKPKEKPVRDAVTATQKLVTDYAEPIKGPIQHPKPKQTAPKEFISSKDFFSSVKSRGAIALKPINDPIKQVFPVEGQTEAALSIISPSPQGLEETPSQPSINGANCCAPLHSVSEPVYQLGHQINSPLHALSTDKKKNIVSMDTLADASVHTDIGKSNPSKAAGGNEVEVPMVVDKPSYRSYQRPPPPKLGQTDIPQGQPNCLFGKKFVITGVLSSLERDDCADLIKSLGGAVTTNVSSRTTHLIAGDEAGPKKVSMAKEKGIPIMNEDELFKLISSSSSITNSSAQSGNSKISKAKQLPVLQAAMSGPDTFLMWVDKYKPTTSSQLCANATLITKLSRFLKDWPNTDAGKHAVLLSGPPGIGKSSAAGICAKEAGYTVIEMNASTTRSKKSLLAHTKELLQSHNISRFFTSSSSVSAKGSMGKKTVLIMDEVDGMSNGDRGGMQELYLLIKTTKIPIICICNDRNSMKVKTLASYCIDLRFRRPMATQIAQRMQSIAKAEGLEIDQPALMKLAEITHGDIRQMLNTMQMWRAGSTSTSFEDIKRSPAKDFDSSAFDVAPQLFHTVSPLQSDWLSKRMEAYFVDPDLIPLMVQGNYLNCIPQLPIEESSQPERYRELFYLERYSKAASSISDGDIIGNQIRSMSSWSLMPVHGVLSSVVPAVHVAGRLQGMIDFPQWLGKNSIRRKNQRLLSEIHSCLVGHISGGTSLDIALDYLPVLRRRLTQPLSVHGQEGINEVIKMMNHYHLSRTDFDTLIELGNGLYEKISLDSKVKAKFTREFSRRSIAPSVSGKRARLPAIDREKFIGDDEGEHSSPDIDIDEGTDSENGNEFDIPAPSKKSAASKKPDVSKRKAPAKSTSLRKKVRA